MCMGYIHCCGGLRKTKSYKLVPRDNFVLSELDVLKKCPVCGHFVVQLTRVSDKDEISTVRKVNAKAERFFNSLKKFILYEDVQQKMPSTGYGRFYLNYNEFGVRKRCYSNLSALKIGLYENKDFSNNLQSF